MAGELPEPFQYAFNRSNNLPKVDSPGQGSARADQLDWDTTVTLTLGTSPTIVTGVHYWLEYQIWMPPIPQGGNPAVWWQGTMEVNPVLTTALTFPCFNGIQLTLNLNWLATWRLFNGGVKFVRSDVFQTTYTPDVANSVPNWITPGYVPTLEGFSAIPWEASGGGNATTEATLFGSFPVAAAPNALAIPDELAFITGGFLHGAYGASVDTYAPVTVTLALDPATLPSPAAGVTYYLQYQITGTYTTDFPNTVYKGSMPLNLQGTNKLVFPWANGKQATLNLWVLGVWTDPNGQLNFTTSSPVKTLTNIPLFGDLSVSAPGQLGGTFTAIDVTVGG